MDPQAKRPFRVSTRRLFTVQYALGVRSTRYSTETIFGRTAEQFGNQTVSVSLTLRQRWGTVGSTLEAASFLPQLDRNHATLFGDVDLNLVRGLSLNLNANITSLRDQVYLPRVPATSEEVLVLSWSCFCWTIGHRDPIIWLYLD